jgi:hypothetical protein
MGLEDFHGRWGVMTSGRDDKIPAGFDKFLCIDTKGGADAWTLKRQQGDDTPTPLGDRQTDKGHQDGGANGLQRIYCTVTFEEADFHFEAVLTRNLFNNNRLIYGHLYPKAIKEPIGEGAVGGWSADRQGDPPIKEQ